MFGKAKTIFNLKEQNERRECSFIFSLEGGQPSSWLFSDDLGKPVLDCHFCFQDNLSSIRCHFEVIFLRVLIFFLLNWLFFFLNSDILQ